jgi:hypothetical protein
MPSGVLETTRWNDLVGSVRHQRMTGLLQQAVLDGALPASAEQIAEVSLLHRDDATTELLLERCMLSVTAQLFSAGIDYRILKGPATAHLDYPQPALRSFADIDLLVPADDFDKAATLIAGAGGQHHLPELDLHRNFVSGPFGLRVDPADLFATVETFCVHGVTVSALDRELRFLQACYNSAFATLRPRLVPLRDVAQLALRPDLDTERVQRLCERWHGQAVVASALAMAWRTFDLADATHLSTWALRYRFTDRERFDLSPSMVPGLSWGDETPTAPTSSHGTKHTVVYTGALARPTELLRRRSGQGKVSRWREMLALRRLWRG